MKQTEDPLNMVEVAVALVTLALNSMFEAVNEGTGGQIPNGEIGISLLGCYLDAVDTMMKIINVAWNSVWSDENYRNTLKAKMLQWVPDIGEHVSLSHSRSFHVTEEVFCKTLVAHNATYGSISEKTKELMKRWFGWDETGVRMSMILRINENFKTIEDISTVSKIVVGRSKTNADYEVRYTLRSEAPLAFVNMQSASVH